MANQRLTDKTAYGGTLSLSDLIHIVDVSDTSQNAAGSSFKLPLSTVKTLVDSSIYVTDGTLTSNRAVSMNTFNIEFTNGNIGIGASPSARLSVKGADAAFGTKGFFVENSSSSRLIDVRNNGHIGFGVDADVSFAFKFQGGSDLVLIRNIGSAAGDYSSLFIWNSSSQLNLFSQSATGTSLLGYTRAAGIIQAVGGTTTDLSLSSSINGNHLWGYTAGSFTEQARFDTTSGSLGIGVIPTAKLHVVGIGATSATFGLKINNSASSPLFYVRNDGRIGMNGIQTGNAGLATGDLYKDTAANILANGDLVVGIKV